MSEELSHWQSLTAMSLGGLAYRLGNFALLSATSRFSGVAAPLLRGLVPALSLGGEVATYELSQRGLLALSGDHSNPNSFCWSGTGGIWEGLKNSYVNFGFLKLGGNFHTQNIFLQHLTQDIAMVAGHEATAQLGWVPHENGNLLERLAHAEVTNLQLGFAMSVVHRILPGLRRIEQNLESIRNRPETGHASFHPELLSMSANPAPKVWVGADFSMRASKKFNPHMIRVRKEGIQNEEDLQYAIQYLETVDIQFGKLFEILRQHKIPILIGAADLDYSYARPTFNGHVDRTSPDYAREIVLHPGATPDVLLHEALHALPLSIIQECLGMGMPSFPISTLRFPAVNPAASFTEIREAIFENIRLNETISFSSQACLFERERWHAITPVFHSEMMKDIDHAWSEDRFAGVRNTFPQYLPHYEERLGWTSILMALIVKVEGRTQLSEAEYRSITRSVRGEIPFGVLLEKMQEYLARYVREKGYELAEDFYSLSALARRIQIHSLEEISTNKLAEIIDGIFASLQDIENTKNWDRKDSSSQEAVDLSRPPENMPERVRLFAAYAGVVDRVVENPPADLSREELSALVSFARMLPAEQAQEIAMRLLVYLGKGLEDLRVSLGIILHEKGFRSKGQELVSKSVQRPFLGDIAPLLLKFMGPKFLRPLLVREAAQITTEQAQESTAFQMAALGHFIWEEGPLAEHARILLQHSWLLRRKNWNRLGRLLFEKGDVDSAVADKDLFDLENNFDENLKTETRFLQTLNRLREDPLLDSESREEIRNIRRAWVEKNRKAYAALREVFKDLNDFSLLTLIADRAEVLACFSAEEVQEIFKNYPPKQRVIAITLAECRSTRPYRHPEVVGPLAKNCAQTLKQMMEAGEDKEIFQNLYFLLQTLIDHETLHPQAEGSKANFRPALEIVLEPSFAKQIDEENLLDSIDQIRFSFPHFFASRFDLDNRIGHGTATSDPEILLYWIGRALQINSAQATHYFELGFDTLQASLIHIQGGMGDESIKWLLLSIIPHALHLIHVAQRSGHLEMADRFSKLLFEDLPRIVPSQKIYRKPEVDDDNGKRFEQLLEFYPQRAALAWTFQMDREARLAQRAGHSSEWLRRIREEIARGGGLVTVEGLRYLAENFEKDLNTFQSLLELMIQKSIQEPNQENITKTLRTIEDSSLDNESKDRLMADFTGRLFQLIQSFRGLDLNLLHQLQHLFPWRTPFMRAGDLPHYPQTESLLLCKLAEIQELVNPRKDKQDRVRLAAFSAAGLPLQRYAEHMEALFSNPHPVPNLRALASRKKFREIYARLNLPSTDNIPMLFSSQEVQAFLGKHQAVLENLLRGDPENAETQAALRLIHRMLGSELRSLRKAQDSQTPRSAELWPQSVMNHFLLDWTQRQYASSTRSACLEKIQEILFEAGPPELRRLGLARHIYESLLSRAERQKLFSQATQHLVFSRRTQKRLEELREAPDENTEKSFQLLLLSLHYERHPGNMVSDYFLEALEKESDLQKEYQKFLSAQASRHPLVIAEVGLTHESDTLVQTENWTQFSLERRFAIYYYGLRFLKRYLLRERNILALTDGDYFDFKETNVEKDLEHYQGDLGSILEKGVSFEDIGFIGIHHSLRKISEVLSATGWAQKVSEYLDKLETNENEAGLRETFMRGILPLDKAIQAAEQDYRNIIASEFTLKMKGLEIPDFIRSRQGLERDLLSYVLAFLHPAQRSLLNQRLALAQNDSERLRTLGECSHLEKLLQGASIHPVVPREYQEQFAIFQEEVPSRDPLDVQATIHETLLESERAHLQVDVNHPLKEGTIGGIYPGTFEGRPIVIKVIPHGKWNALEDSLRIVAEIRRMLWATQYQQAGSRATDDFLTFYERSIREEMNLRNDLENAAKLEAILPDRFVVPEYLEEITVLDIATMRPLHSRRLRELSPEARADFFRRMDEVLIPLMIKEGIFHYDLHPGNLGLHENGDIVLYDTGRVGTLTEEQRVFLYLFYAALNTQNYAELPRILRKFGSVRDEQAYSRISELLERAREVDPMKAIEQIYPKLADYGFVLHDSFHKLLFMFITWEGTKKSFRGEDFSPKLTTQARNS